MNNGNPLERNPWIRKSSEIIYTNPWITVREDRVIRPDGEPGVYGVVDTRVATGAVAITPTMDVYLVGQYRYPTEGYSWEIIEGGTDEGETPLECIRRELREEAGLIAQKWTPLGGEVHLSNCISSENGYLFLAEDLEETEPEPEATEVLQIRRVPFAEALAMTDEGEITDAISIMGLLLAERYLRRHRDWRP